MGILSKQKQKQKTNPPKKHLKKLMQYIPWDPPVRNDMET